jgi:hypothetical protein
MKKKKEVTMRNAVLGGLAAAVMFATGSAFGADPSALKSTLTPFGAERAGSADGAIPAWTGAMPALPANYKSGDPMPDFFAADKPLYSVTAANLDQYRAKLAEGVVELIKRYPDYRVDVYPTRRPAAAPEWVYDNTYRNATEAKPVADGAKFGFTGGYGGIPFPILDADPATAGAQAVWNHLTRWQGDAVTRFQSAYVVNASGTRTLSSYYQIYLDYPYYDKAGSSATFKGYNYYLRAEWKAPATLNGQSLIQWQSINTLERNNLTWQYLLGQGRVRKAPSVAYDSPAPETSGIMNYDDYYTFNGALDRYDWTLVGKAEMIVPYNNNKVVLASEDQAHMAHFLNPDITRWEVHRVWVVDGKLAEGKRHVVPHRRLYIDEDTWTSLMTDQWDAQGKYWKFIHNLMEVRPDMPAVLYSNSVGYNLQSQEYTTMGGAWLGGKFTEPSYAMVKKPALFFEAQSLIEDAVK